MSKLTKNQKLALEKIEAGKAYSLAEATEKVKEVNYAKFDASLDIDVRLGVDPRCASSCSATPTPKLPLRLLAPTM